MKIRSYPLAERRAQAAVMSECLKRHERECLHCLTRSRCSEARHLAVELADARRDVQHWFDPGPDQAPLFDVLTND